VKETNNVISDKNDKNLSVRSILNAHWEAYSSKYQIPEYIQQEVTKCLACHSPRNGCFLYYCPKCNDYVTLAFGCNSRICSCCGKRYTDQWAESLSHSMFDVPHRHFVFSVPSALWPFIYEQVSRWKIYMDAVIESLNDFMPKLLRNPQAKPAVIVILHPFGKDIKFQPHLHLIIAEGGFLPDGTFMHKRYIPADGMRKNWQYHVLKMLQEHGLANTLATKMYDDYPNGFYVWLHRNGRISSPKKIGKYLCRYVRHPAIADSRIDYFDDEIVKFHYYNEIVETKVKERVDVVRTIDDFLTGLVQHIPTPQFKMIRYYGCYSRGLKRKYGSHSSIVQKKLYHYGVDRVIPCPRCGAYLEFIMYSAVPPPEKEKLTPENIEYWIRLATESEKQKLKISQRS